jgi:TonB-dependent starch-binding outer membrane protein SusC
MRKTATFKSLLVVVLSMFVSLSVFAQGGTVTGTVTTEEGAAIIGATIFEKGINNGTKTNTDGKFALALKGKGEFIIVSADGMATQTLPINGNDFGTIKLSPRTRQISDVVVVGYGSTKAKDVTGSVTSIKAKDFVQGNVGGSPEQLIIGKAPGIQITSAGGAPGSGSRIRIRGGSSLNASNDPLIVIDGVPVDNFKMGGSANPLNMINPNDVESIDILKDASATAIYGSRASNGVIQITTKRGSKKGGFHINYNTTNSVQTPNGRYADMLNPTEFRELYKLTQSEANHTTLGNNETDWKSLILRNAFATDNNLSFSGGIKNLPYRISLGYFGQQGMINGGGLDRGSLGINLNPTFLNNTLKVNINARGSSTRTRFTDEGAIGAANTFDPTQSPYSELEQFGKYFAWVDAAGNPITIAPSNPLAMVNLRDDISTSERFLGNIQFDYQLPFLKGLRANLNLGTDAATTRGNKKIPYTSVTGDGYFREGKNEDYGESRQNKLLDFYLNYKRELGASSVLDVTGGYSYQDFYRKYPTFDDFTNLGNYQSITNIDGLYKAAGPMFASQYTILSFFGRANYSYKSRYLLTATLRNDNTSRFSPENRAGYFPAVAAAWRISEEGFLKSNKTINNLKLRAGWGQTGQQDLFLNDRPVDYLYLARYKFSDNAAAYQIGNDFVPTLRPEAIDANITWETTTTSNIGLDFGLFKNRVNGTIDLYNRDTKDLLAFVAVSAGTATSDKVLTNIGSLRNRGVELGLNFVPVATKNFTWDLGFNYTYNQNKIISMSNNDSSFAGILTGGADGGVGTNVQILKPGLPINQFNLYQQVYDAASKPIEGAYVDQNEDGIINENDRITSYNSEPRNLFGLSTNLSFKRFNVGVIARAQTGSFVYNNTASSLGNLLSMRNGVGYNSNIHGSYYDTRFNTQQILSDYYIESADFLRIDNINVGYNFGQVIKSSKNAGNLRASFIVQNAFLFTNYTGIDPEVTKDGNNGIDRNLYPRPRTYSIALNLDL